MAIETVASFSDEAHDDKVIDLTKESRKRKIDGTLDPTNIVNLGALPQEWREHAACKNHPTIDLDRFFEVSITRKNASKILEVQKLCFACPVAAECLREALIFNYDGMWGGLTHKQRVAYIRNFRNSSVVDLSVKETRTILNELRSDAAVVMVSRRSSKNKNKTETM